MKKLLKTLFIITLPLLAISCASVKYSYDDSIYFTINSSAKTSKDYFEKAINYIYEQNDPALSFLFDKWNKEAPSDCELFVARYIYYLNKATTEEVLTTKTPPKDGQPYITLLDQDTNENIYEYHSFSYKQDILKIALENIIKAISLHPNRGDLYPELISTLINNENISEAVKVIKAYIKQGKENDNKWLLGMNSVPEYINDKVMRNQIFSNTIHSYITYLFNTGHEKESIDILHTLEKAFPSLESTNTNS